MRDYRQVTGSLVELLAIGSLRHFRPSNEAQRPFVEWLWCLDLWDLVSLRQTHDMHDYEGPVYHRYFRLIVCTKMYGKLSVLCHEQNPSHLGL